MVTYDAAGHQSTDPSQFENILLTLRDIGFDGVEPLSVPEKLHDMRAIRDLCVSYQMKIPMIAGVSGKYGKIIGTYPDKDPTSVDEKRRDAAIEYYQRSVDLAVIFDTKYVQVSLGSLEEQDTSQKGIENAITNLADVLKKSARYAKESGVGIIFEPQCRFEGYYGVNNTVRNSLRVLERVDEENIFLMLDTFHSNIEEISLSSALEEARTRLRHVHIADNQRLPPGYGSLDFRSLIKHLMLNQYSGFLGMECMPIGANVNSLLRNSLNYMKSSEKITEEQCAEDLPQKALGGSTE